jgi:polar amino acid transport system substrate-binding protein
MLTMKRLSLTVPVIATAVAIAATSGAEAKSHSPIATAASSAPTSTTPASSAPKLPTVTPGVLTIATDSPAEWPYFIHDNPSNGEGFESAVAYAVAKELGFKPAQVKWVVEPLNAATAPGKKSFDFDINEIPITPAGAKDVSFSTPYYSDPLAVIVARGGQFKSVKKLSGLAANGVIGVQLNTTELQAVTDLIDPIQQAAAFDTPTDILEAYTTKEVNAIVTDLATSVELARSLPKAKVLGQFAYPGGDTWGLVLQKHSPLTRYVDHALGVLKGTGTLRKLTNKWIASAATIPVLK